MGERVRASCVWLRYGSLVAAVVGALVLAPSLHAQTPDPAPTPSPAARPDQQPQARTPTSTQPPAAQEGFVPVEQLPNPQDTIPAPRLVATAYACVWIVLMAYLYSIWRRLGTVQRELDVVSRRLSTGNRSR